MMALWQPIKEWIKDMTKVFGIYGTPFYQWCADNLLLVFIICGLIAFIGVILIVILVLSAKASKRKKAIRNAELAAEAAKAKAIADAEAKAKAEEEARIKAEEEAKAAELKAQEEAEAAAKAEAEAKAKAEAEAKAKAKAEAEAKAKAAEEARIKAEQEAKAKAEAKAKKEAEAKAKKEAEAKAKKEAELAASEAAKSASVEASEAAESEKSARYRGKWVICRLVTDAENPEDREETYFFELRASNGEKLLSSQEYTSLAGAKRGIATHVSNIKNGNFKIALTKKGDYIFKLMSGNNTLLCTGENYSTQVRCERAIESTKRFGETAVIDEDVEEHLIKIPAEEETAAATPVTDNANGKWIIVKKQTAEGAEAYYFELFANNGEKLLSSEEYSSQLGAVNGVETHKKNIEKGNFRIVLTKRGDYIYKLLNGNGQLLCLGEHYKTKRLCQNAVESVKRFALSSPILAENEGAK